MLIRLFVAGLLLLPFGAAGDSVRYSYDAAGRLIGADYGASKISYTYDKAGNLLKREVSASGPRVVSLSSASYDLSGILAPDAIAVGFGTGFAAALAVATSADLPTELGGASVDVTDSAGTKRRAKLVYVAPNQISYLVPTGTALGTATVTVNVAGGGTIGGTVQVANVAPGIYTANQQGTGVASAFFLRAGSGGQVQDLLFNPGTGASVPVDLGAESDQVFLLIFGTGMRGVQQGASATVGGVNVPVAGPVAHSVFAGLDQINLGPLPRSLAGRGKVDIAITVDGKAANVVKVNIR